MHSIGGRALFSALSWLQLRPGRALQTWGSLILWFELATLLTAFGTALAGGSRLLKFSECNVCKTHTPFLLRMLSAFLDPTVMYYHSGPRWGGMRCDKEREIPFMPARDLRTLEINIFGAVTLSQTLCLVLYRGRTIIVPILGMRKMENVQICAQGHTANCGLPLNCSLLTTIDRLPEHKEYSRKMAKKESLQWLPLGIEPRHGVRAQGGFYFSPNSLDSQVI